MTTPLTLDMVEHKRNRGFCATLNSQHSALYAESARLLLRGPTTDENRDAACRAQRNAARTAKYARDGRLALIHNTF